MSKKGYLHIAEYDLTKRLLDRLGIDIEDDYELVAKFGSLSYKDRPVVFPPYDQCIKYNDSGVILRPFTNMSHASYLINLFGDIKKCEVVFEYKDGNEGTLDGLLKIEKKKKGKRQVSFRGIKNQSVLMATLILKDLLNQDLFRTCVGSIFKIDRKMSERHALDS